MTDLLSNTHYLEDIAATAGLPLPWQFFQNKTILISGATGMIGRYLIDVLMVKNSDGLNCRIIAVGRKKKTGKERFSRYWDCSTFSFVEADINSDDLYGVGHVDLVLHAASNTHPVAYATEPIDTIATNVIGTNNLLKLSERVGAKRFLFLSSVEIYGQNRGDCETFSEDYCGYIDCNTLRAGYPESKRLAEAMCQAYLKEKKLDVVIARLARVYGPTMLSSDTKALSQFIKKGVKRENIVLKSAGTQLYSYCYVADVVSALLILFANGVCGEAYNVTDSRSDIYLKDLASIIAGYVGRKVVFEIPDAVEAEGYSKATTALLNPQKMCNLGWQAYTDIKAGIERTIDILT